MKRMHPQQECRRHPLRANTRLYLAHTCTKRIPRNQPSGLPHPTLLVKRFLTSLILSIYSHVSAWCLPAVKSGSVSKPFMLVRPVISATETNITAPALLALTVIFTTVTYECHHCCGSVVVAVVYCIDILLHLVCCCGSLAVVVLVCCCTVMLRWWFFVFVDWYFDRAVVVSGQEN